jgi:hypothetical protein
VKIAKDAHKIRHFSELDFRAMSKAEGQHTVRTRIGKINPFQSRKHVESSTILRKVGLFQTWVGIVLPVYSKVEPISEQRKSRRADSRCIDVRREMPTGRANIGLFSITFAIHAGAAEPVDCSSTILHQLFLIGQMRPSIFSSCSTIPRPSPLGFADSPVADRNYLLGSSVPKIRMLAHSL